MPMTEAERLCLALVVELALTEDPRQLRARRRELLSARGLIMRATERAAVIEASGEAQDDQEVRGLRQRVALLLQQMNALRAEMNLVLKRLVTIEAQQRKRRSPGDKPAGK
jgi:hypothetical protein